MAIQREKRSVGFFPGIRGTQILATAAAAATARALLSPTPAPSRHEGRIHDPDLPQQELLNGAGRVPGSRGWTEPAKRREDPEGVRVELVLAREVPRHRDAGFLVSSA